jgi:hypothetical protein
MVVVSAEETGTADHLKAPSIIRRTAPFRSLTITKRPVAMNDLIEEICSWIDPNLHHLVRTTSDFRKMNGGRPRA